MVAIDLAVETKGLKTNTDTVQFPGSTSPLGACIAATSLQGRWSFMSDPSYWPGRMKR